MNKMDNKNKKNKFLVLIILSTIALGVMAIVMALKLYQIGTQPVAPSTPASKPEATSSTCQFTFTVGGISTPTPTPTPTGGQEGTPTPTPTPTSTPTPTTGTKKACFDQCSLDLDCQTGLRCLDSSGTKRCLNPDCPSETDCGCNQCWGTCTEDPECASGLNCVLVGSQKRCVDKDCPEEQDCNCPATPTLTATPTPTTAQAGPTSTPRPTAEPTQVTEATEAPAQPVTGLKIPTLGGILSGFLLISLGFALIL